MYEWVTVLKNGSTSVIAEERYQDAGPHPLERKTLNESIPWFWTTDEWRMKWHIICASSKTDLQFLKTEPGCSKTTYRTAQVQKFYSLSRPVELLSWRRWHFSRSSHFEQDVDPPSRSREQTPEYGIGTFDIVIEKEVQNSTTGRKNDVDTIWGVLGDY